MALVSKVYRSSLRIARNWDRQPAVAAIVRPRYVEYLPPGLMLESATEPLVSIVRRAFRFATPHARAPADAGAKALSAAFAFLRAAREDELQIEALAAWEEFDRDCTNLLNGLCVLSHGLQRAVAVVCASGEGREQLPPTERPALLAERLAPIRRAAECGVDRIVQNVRSVAELSDASGGGGKGVRELARCCATAVLRAVAIERPPSKNDDAVDGPAPEESARWASAVSRDVDSFCIDRALAQGRGDVLLVSMLLCAVAQRLGFAACVVGEPVQCPIVRLASKPKAGHSKAGTPIFIQLGNSVESLARLAGRPLKDEAFAMLTATEASEMIAAAMNSALLGRRLLSPTTATSDESVFDLRMQYCALLSGAVAACRGSSRADVLRGICLNQMTFLLTKRTLPTGMGS